MDHVEDKQSAMERKGLSYRKSYNSIFEHENDQQLQSVEMRREGSSGQSSIKSQTTVCSSRTESVWSKDDVEEAIPGQPLNFGTVVPGVYRSSYPKEADYPFLEKLGLKTIITLVDKEMPETFIPFMQANGICHRHILMEGTKKQTIPIKTMVSILEVIHDKHNHPVLIHCNQGKHRTGCVVAITRMIQQWNTERILDEYKAYASPKIRDGDVEYISKFQLSDIEHMGFSPLVETGRPLPLPQPIRPQPLERAHRGRLLATALVVILVWVSIESLINCTRSNLPQGP
ncbi:tyrosine-protein phosphatase siw14 [Gnomoniopsis sp. IMI 355080]|nr:tyrosine-protein phosphatase siw14 [Gnomoniopsis sp. IMI 355080]